jgi:hypothetical protein
MNAEKGAIAGDAVNELLNLDLAEFRDVKSVERLVEKSCLITPFKQCKTFVKLHMRKGTDLTPEESDGKSNQDIDGGGVFDQEYDEIHRYQADMHAGSEIGPSKSTTKPGRTKIRRRIAELLQLSGICKYKKGRKLKDVDLWSFLSQLKTELVESFDKQEDATNRIATPPAKITARFSQDTPLSSRCSSYQPTPTRFSNSQDTTSTDAPRAPVSPNASNSTVPTVFRNIDDCDIDMLQSIRRTLDDDGDSISGEIDDAENGEEVETGAKETCMIGKVKMTKYDLLAYKDIEEHPRKAGIAALRKMNIAAVRKNKKIRIESYREVGDVVHQYVTSLEKGYDDFLVSEVASDEEEESTWCHASDNLLSP